MFLISPQKEKRVRLKGAVQINSNSFFVYAEDDTGKTFLKSYCAVLLEGAIIVLACIIFSVFASSPPTVDASAAAVTQVWTYIGELIFNMLVLVGSVKMADRIVREMMGL